MYAVLVTGGKQYKVSEGDILYIEKLDAEDGKKVKFDQVLIVSDDGKLTVGSPTIKGAEVQAKVLKTGKAKKIKVFKYNAKKNYRKRQGHRQLYTKVQIDKIKIAKPKAEKAAAEA